MEIRPPLNVSEVSDMTSVRVTSAVDEYSQPEGPSAQMVRTHYAGESAKIAERIITGKSSSLCAAIGSRIVGMCVWSDADPHIVKIEYLYIEPGHRDSGIGSLLVSAALGFIGNDKCVHLYTHSAQDFYKNWGFKERDEYDTDIITHEQLMIKEATS